MVVTMFYCESCRALKSWPGIVPVSTGRCEICGKTAACYDTPSKNLPTESE